MAKTLTEWMKEVNGNPIFKDCGQMYQEHFFRNPYRPIIKRPDTFLASADGVVVSNKVYDIRQDYHFLKGAEVDIPAIIGNDKTFWDYLKANSVSHVKIISIFMTYYSVHINRVPIDSKLVKRTTQAPLASKNCPMIEVEEMLTKGITDYHSSIAGYWSDNERVCNHYAATDYNLHYLINQVADEEVNCVWNLNDSSSNFAKQGSRLGGIMKGSQCDLILPILPNIAYEDLCQVNTVVEAGVDEMVKVIAYDKIETAKFYQEEVDK